MSDQVVLHPIPTRENRYLHAHAQLLANSYLRWTGQPLIADSTEETLSSDLFFSPRVVASHDTQASPVFNYANVAALKLWETDWETFTSMPSSRSAEAQEQSQREALLARASAEGYIKDYSGVRVTTTGRRFKIFDAVVWNVVDDDGVLQGQAVCFDKWEFLD